MVSRHSAFYTPLIVTIAGGFLEDEGFQAEYSVMTPRRGVADALRDGSVDLGQLAVSVSWTWMEQGRTNDILHFAQINERDGFFLAAREADPDFRWSKLIGREVLVDHFQQPLAMFRYACHRAGVDYAAIRSIDAGTPAEMESAFRAGRGEYVHLQGPAPQQLEKLGLAHVVAAVGEAIGPVAFSSLAATRRWLATDAARAFMRAYRRAREYANTAPPSEIAGREAGFFPAADLDVLATTIAAYQALGCWAPDPRIQRAHYETALDVFVHAGAITKRHPYAAVVAPPPDEA